LAQPLRDLADYGLMHTLSRFSVLLGLTALCAMALMACERSLPFADYQREVFDTTAITATATHVIKLANPAGDAAQHVRSIAFDAGGNPGGHFAITEVLVGGRRLAERDLSVPPGAALELHITYAPRDLETTTANYGGQESGAPTRPGPKGAQDAMATLLAESPPMPQALHRALINVLYDHPKEGVTQLEMIGTAIPGPHGEISALGPTEGEGSAAGPCAAGGTTACFAGTLSLEIPGIMAAPVETTLAGPWKLSVDDGVVQAIMADFPLALFVVKGNGPGEPLEGQPIGAISIAISGHKEAIATGRFDGESLALDAAVFRTRIYFAEMQQDQVTSTTAPVDFDISGVEITTESPLADGKITLAMETTLGENPSGNALADPLLSGITIVVKLMGTLTLP
jgi:hypothetical protein